MSIADLDFSALERRVICWYKTHSTVYDMHEDTARIMFNVGCGPGI